MPNWTKEQLLAIEESGKNIIVSAGAGSGKTAVLTERVIRKLQKGVDINHLLILTFTNAAAKEMKERIRKAIKKNNLVNQLDKIDSSYITTFDSFSLSILKKYHYLLNIDKDVKIADSLILKWKKQEILDGIFNNYYNEENKLFLKLIQDFTTRDDTNLKKYLLILSDKINLKYDSKNYLNTYLDTYYNENYLTKKIQEYENNLLTKKAKIKDNLDQIELIVDGDFFFSLNSSLEKLLIASNYDEIRSSLDINLPRLKKGMDDVKPYKEKISNIIKELTKLTIYESKEFIYQTLLNTKDTVSIIIDILKKLDYEFLNYKMKNNLFDFLDISKLAISILENYPNVRNELKDYFEEILVDEYQDTSDIQELFISLISNNNVYMVGDIKQSIYRFRNANPNLFKEKYSNYEKNIDGIKIDLVKNFRSREETLNNINFIFNQIMDLEIGGADYKTSHQMVFGNTLYNEYKPSNQDNNFEIYNYELSNKEYTKDEVEAFITANDILEKVQNKYQVFDKDNNILRDITYDDFVILIDKSTSFDLYKKIFEYKNIPLTILKDENIAASYDLYIIKNILILLKKIKENIFDQEFKYAYLSVGRSYLFSLDDNYLYHVLINNKYIDDEILKLIKSLSIEVDYIPVNVLIEKIIEKFNFYERLITVGNINESIIRLDYLKDLSKNLSFNGYTYLEFLDYLSKLINDNEEIKYSLNKEIKNSVKIMTIHKSKGLEYHICYYTGLNNKFNLMDTKQKFIFDNNLGIITPVIYQDTILNTIYHTMYKDDYIKENISEKIRLFYVAMTRAKEKMILITSLKDEENENDELVSLDTRLKYSSLASILNSIKDKLTPYLKEIDLNKFGLTKDYNLLTVGNILKEIEPSLNKIEVKELKINLEVQKEEKFSKTSYELMTEKMKEKLEFGTYLHYLLEIIDFKKKDLSLIDKKYQKYLEMFFNSDLLKNIENSSIYKEYEFITEVDNVKKHGIIDLMIEHDDYIDIIDYKLKNIDDLEYHKQLRGYKDYIKTKTSKNINLYLYSITEGRYEKIN